MLRHSKKKSGREKFLLYSFFAVAVSAQGNNVIGEQQTDRDWCCLLIVSIMYLYLLLRVVVFVYLVLAFYLMLVFGQ